MPPVLSIVMPVYNGEKYLEEAINSILNQTFCDFEFIILNDGSTDKSEDIILSFKDKRIVYVRNEKNLKITRTLNKGIKLSRGKYIARIDADDISAHNRFDVQIRYIQEKDIDFVGSNILLIDSKSKKIGNRHYPETDLECKELLLYGSCFAHPSLLAKSEAMKSIGYHEVDAAEDYDAWKRASSANYVFGNVQENLLQYRIHENQIMTQYSDKSKKYLKKNISKASILRYKNGDLHDYSAIQAASVLYIRDLVSISTLKYIFKYQGFIKILLIRIIKAVV
jgi:glycosyltransferase involved in cell wall biosynthesis